MFVKPLRMDQACWFCNYNTISLKNMELMLFPRDSLNSAVLIFQSKNILAYINCIEYRLMTSRGFYVF
jgi:hypothetical protein